MCQARSRLKAGLPKKGRWLHLGDVAVPPDPPQHLVSAVDAAVENAWMAKEDFDTAMALYKAGKEDATAGAVERCVSRRSRVVTAVTRSQ
jgi:hypothetical protein